MFPRHYHTTHKTQQQYRFAQVSYFIYGVLGGVRFFSGLHVLVLFVILGVGADDIFVLVDAWKQVVGGVGG